ncbi:MAG TPA: hypothetical protein PKO28_03835 [Bacilli bacterium]|nr:hypothetical protein [Bacilli bacterium]HPS18954.1 hypothetical protein [Bacilli bacterium]
MAPKSELKHLDEYLHLQAVLNSINSFVAAHPITNYIEFDYYIAHDLTLFFIEPNIDFDVIGSTLELIKKSLPAMKRIFAKPIIALKDIPEVSPVELVSKTNQDTLFHLANHFNNVGNIKNGRIKPRKLLTQIYEDDYSIYENVIFCNFVDEVIRYCKKNMRYLENLLYASEVMEFNLLERVNHIDYYMALGKLHTGYIRDYHRYYDSARRLYNDCLFILNTIESRLHKPIYRQNKKRKAYRKLKKTNIFINQKDYRRVYLTYKYFIANKIVNNQKEEKVDLAKLQKNYFLFVKMLSIFSLSHFSFETKSTAKINLHRLNVDFTFKKWKINLHSVEGKYLLVTFNKDNPYRILLYPSLDSATSLDEIELKKDYQYDELILVSPLHGDGQKNKPLFISMENIDSFRRIQQLLLKGMIYADKERHDCPFCLKELVFDEKKSAFVCPDCRTEIYEDTCLDSGKKYFYTKIANFKPASISALATTDYGKWFKERKIEAAYYYRNITDINEEGEIVCPECHHIHHHSH